MDDIVTVSITDLFIDPENPRFASIHEGQADAIEAMVNRLGDKLLALGRDVVDNGTDPTSLPLIVPIAGNKSQYTVREGNRRVVVLKLLHNPDLAAEAWTASRVKRLRALANELKTHPIREIRCVVVKDEKAANHWIALRHRGEAEGAGLVGWGNEESQRFDARAGNKSIELQALDFVTEKGKLDESTRRKLASQFPLTNLARLLSNSEVLAALGLEKHGTELVTKYPDAEVLKGLTRVVADIATGAVKVRDIYDQQKQINYISSFDKTERPDAKKAGTELRGLEGATPASPARGKAKPVKGKAAGERKTVIPRNLSLPISDSRIKHIFGELRKLKCTEDEFVNAAAVTFRVFIELCMDAYDDKFDVLPVDAATKGHPKLRDKIERVAADLASRDAITDAVYKAIKKSTNDTNFLAAGVQTFHEYVHNKHIFPKTRELQEAWDTYQPFITALWQGIEAAS
jgi:hypothetical protein